MPSVYRYSNKLGSKYNHEEGTEGARRTALRELQNSLISAIELAEAATTKARQTGTVFETNSPRLAGESRVKQLAKQFENAPIELDKTMREANANAINIRAWLTRQGALVAGDGTIRWPKCNAVVKYDHELAAQNMTRITIRGGLLHTANGQLLDTTKMVTHFSGPGYAIYVMSKEGNIHVTSHSVGQRHHSSLLAGAAVAGAGELRARYGRIQWLSNKSGHYVPDIFLLMQTLFQLKSQQVPMSFPVQYHTSEGAQLYPTVKEFKKANRQALNGFKGALVDEAELQAELAENERQQKIADEYLAKKWGYDKSSGYDRSAGQTPSASTLIDDGSGYNVVDDGNYISVTKGDYC